MIKSILTAAVILPFLAATTAHAQNFTYESSANDPLIVGGIGPSGNDYLGAYWTSENTTQLDDGTTRKSNSVCVSMRQPPNNQIFDSHIACEVTVSDGTFSAVFGCTLLDAKTNEMSCVGGLRGKSGAYKGKMGTITNYVKNGSSKGTGQWYE